MTRAVAVIMAMAALTTACAPDPPSAVVGLRAVGCSPHPELGSGIFVAVDGFDEPLVLTSAHVVAGAREVAVTRGDTSGSGTVVAFDPEMDLAYLAVEGLTAGRPWRVADGEVHSDARGAAYVVRDGEQVTVPVTVRRRVQIRTEDIYLEGDTSRPGFELTSEIHAGDSGGAVVVGGEVVGVVWARSRNAAERGYAIDPVRAGDLVREQLRTGDLTGVDPARCR